MVRHTVSVRQEGCIRYAYVGTCPERAKYRQHGSLAWPTSLATPPMAYGSPSNKIMRPCSRHHLQRPEPWFSRRFNKGSSVAYYLVVRRILMFRKQCQRKDRCAWFGVRADTLEGSRSTKNRVVPLAIMRKSRRITQTQKVAIMNISNRGDHQGGWRVSGKDAIVEAGSRDARAAAGAR
jgi:hypothetical protein